MNADHTLGLSSPPSGAPDEVSSEAPVIVELPDGQRLYVKDVPAGTVIEVASWRGTGAPADDTVRLLVGVDNTGAVSTTASTGSAHSTADAADAATVADAINAVDSSGELLTRAGARRSRAGQERPRRGWRRSLIITLGSLLAVAGVLVTIFAFTPLRLVHPLDGAETGFGPVSSVLVVAVHGQRPAAGQMVIARVNNRPFMGRVTALAPQQVLLQTATGYAQVNDSDVSGVAVAMIPYLGYLVP